MTEWNDGRLDDLSKKVDDLGTRMDDGFACVNKKMGEEVGRVEKKMDAGFARVDAKFEALDTKFDKKLDALQRTLLQTACGFAIGMLTFAGALIGLLATKV